MNHGVAVVGGGCSSGGRAVARRSISRSDLWQDTEPFGAELLSSTALFSFNLLSPEPVFQVSGSKMTCPEQMTITSLLCCVFAPARGAVGLNRLIAISKNVLKVPQFTL